VSRSQRGARHPEGANGRAAAAIAAEIEDNINQARTAFVIAKIIVNGEVVNAAGIAGLSKKTDTEIARTAAAAVSPLGRVE
jgi:glc operon protein GlcG